MHYTFIVQTPNSIENSTCISTTSRVSRIQILQLILQVLSRTLRLALCRGRSTLGLALQHLGFALHLTFQFLDLALVAFGDGLGTLFDFVSGRSCESTSVHVIRDKLVPIRDNESEARHTSSFESRKDNVISDGSIDRLQSVLDALHGIFSQRR